MFCREHVVQLRHQVDAIHAAGGELVVVGSGTPNFMAGFREQTGWTGPLYGDPSLASYRAAGLQNALWRNFTPLGLVYGARALARGHMQGRTQGDPSQQGGVLVILPPGRIVYEHKSQVAGDNAPAAEVAQALASAAAA